MPIGSVSSSIARVPTTLSGHEQPVQVIPEAEVHGGPSPAAWSRSAHPVVKYHGTDVGFLWPPRVPVFLEKDKGPHHDVPAASGVGGRGRVDTSCMERPARDGAVGDRVIALEHRDLGGLLPGKPVPLVVGTVGEAGGLADAVVVDPVSVDVGLV